MAQTRATPSGWLYGIPFGLAYLIGVATVIWVATSVVCLGDSRFSSGCGGWSTYFPMWAFMYLPAAGGAVAAGVQDGPRPRVQCAVLAACLVVALAWMFLSLLARNEYLGFAGPIVLGLAFPLARRTMDRRFGGQPDAR